MEIFGQLRDGRTVYSRTLCNRNGMEVTLISYAAAIQAIRVPDAEGKLADVALGFDTAAEYEADTESVGAVVGRCANRIAYARYTLDGEEVKLEANIGEHSLHSGHNGWQNQLWKVADETDDSVTFSLESPAGSQSFPGNMSVSVTYTLRDTNELVLTYRVTTDAPSVCNVTNHVYLNLDGHGSGSVLDHVLMLHADAFTPVGDAMCLPTGEIRMVEGTPLDFRTPVRIGDRIESDYEQMVWGNGYDHNYAYGDCGTMKTMGILRGALSGICAEVSSDRPGVQLYTSNWLPSGTGKGGASYGKWCAVCLETQQYPDAVNQPAFPSPVVRPGEEMITRTIYRFYTEG